MKKVLLSTLGGALILGVFAGVGTFLLFHPFIAGIIALGILFLAIAYIIGWVLWGQPPPRNQ